MMIKNRDEFFRPFPLQTLIHEMVHLAIEQSLVHKYQLEHWEKERIVNLFCLYKFGQLIDRYIIPHTKIHSLLLDNHITPSSVDDLENAIKLYLAKTKS